MPGDVIGLDIFVSSGEGKPKEGEFRTTVYKREIDTQYSLRIASARSFFTEVNKKYPTLPFSIRAFENATSAKIGVTECVTHNLITPYPVLVEKAGETVAQFKATIAILPKSTVILAGNLPFNTTRFETEKRVNNEELVKILSSDLWKKEEKKKGKKATEEEKK
jgi:methionine aminopeptidase